MGYSTDRLAEELSHHIYYWLHNLRDGDMGDLVDVRHSSSSLLCGFVADFETVERTLKVLLLEDLVVCSGPYAGHILDKALSFSPWQKWPPCQSHPFRPALLVPDQYVGLLPRVDNTIGCLNLHLENIRSS